jgi:nucleoid DNA-binding protein
MNTKQLMKAVSAELNISDKLSAAVIKSVIKQIVKASVA